MNAIEASGSHTIYLADLSARNRGDRVELQRAEAKHLKALRLRVGDAVMVTDGKGALWTSHLCDESGVASIELGAGVATSDPLPVDLWAPVGNKQAMLWLVEKATELGVARIRPVEFERSGSVADAGRSQAFWEKARRRAISALKQSGGAWLPELLAPGSLSALLASPASEESRLVVLDRGGRPLTHLIDGPGAAHVVLLVGPEGGLTPAELTACADAGFEVATLGELVLRFETAAVAALAVVSQKRLVEQSDSSERNLSC
jgi:16S rRNA (uracil1498-N3)-methyltransferase